jgi:hypothetical protein
MPRCSRAFALVCAKHLTFSPRLALQYAINREVVEKGRKLREIEVVEVLDKICVKNMDKYGLVLDQNGQVLPGAHTQARTRACAHAGTDTC